MHKIDSKIPYKCSYKHLEGILRYMVSEHAQDTIFKSAYLKSKI